MTQQLFSPCRQGAHPGARYRSGISLVEVLVALVVLSIGLLGLAALQSAGIQDNHSAYLRTQASVLSQDILDRMRANREQALSTSDYETDFGEAAAVLGPFCSPCASPADLADSDLLRWKTALEANLPQGAGRIARNAPTPGVQHLVVTVQWAEKALDPDNDGGWDRDQVVRQFTLRSEL
ncbi:MAG: type IV pilus modification protein PilV [Pseudomonadota bacterium]|nr:type IV pilus modification protein PilV [Pseudomonadota bacterium]